MQTTEINDCQFMGKVTAGFTHEVKNVLAIIRESAGLLEDLLALDPYQALPHREKFVQRLAGIQTQVQRGVELTSRLNRFAHSADERVEQVDLNELVGCLVLLLERFARLQKVVLQASRVESAPVLTISPLQLQRVLFLVVQCCWNRLPDGGELLLRPVDDGDRAGVEVVCGGPSEPATIPEFNAALRTSEHWHGMQAAVASLGGAVAVEPPFCGVQLLFPKRNLP